MKLTKVALGLWRGGGCSNSEEVEIEVKMGLGLRGLKILKWCGWSCVGEDP